MPIQSTLYKDISCLASPTHMFKFRFLTSLHLSFFSSHGKLIAMLSRRERAESEVGKLASARTGRLMKTYIPRQSQGTHRHTHTALCLQRISSWKISLYHWRSWHSYATLHWEVRRWCSQFSWKILGSTPTPLLGNLCC